MYDHNVGPCGEHTDYESRIAIKEYVDEVLHIDLDDKSYLPGRKNMESCATVQEYADEMAHERSVELAVELSIEHGKTQEKAIKILCSEFPQFPKEEMVKRVSELWDKEK